MKDFYLPDLGEGLAEAEIREWYIKEGDVVKVDQPLVSMETAKAVVDVPSPYAGKIVTLHGKANDIIKTGAPLISFELNEEEVKEKPKGTVVGNLEESSKKWDEGEVIIGSPKTKTSNVKAMPAARMLAKQLNVDLNAVKPTNSQGLITPEDVKKYHQQNSIDTKATKKTKLVGETESLHGVRRVMANVMAESHREVVPVTIIEDADITDLPAGVDVTVRIIKAIVSAVKLEPSLNAWFDSNHLERKLFSEVNIGLAVDTDEGLFVPVIKNAAKQSDSDLRNLINRFKTTIKDRSISPNDMQGATITLSNFGTISGRYATPIIVPPTVAILGCGRAREMPVIKNGKVEIGKIIPLSLTFDHQAVTGGEATRFLGEVIKQLKS